MELLLLAGLLFGAGAMIFASDDSGGDTGDEGSDDVPPSEQTGVVGVDDMLVGTEQSDILIGNYRENDTLVGGAGDDTIYSVFDNTATGGEGADRFYAELSFGDMLITDFNTQEDTLVLRNDEFGAGEDGPHPDNLVLLQTEDGLELVNDVTGDVALYLPGVQLGEGESLRVTFEHLAEGETGEDAEVLETEELTLSVSEPPFFYLMTRGTDGDDTIVGGDGYDPIFGEDGADSLVGGDGDDELYGGSADNHLWPYYNHAPGMLVSLGGYDTLDGGAGDDALWFGGGSEVTGGEGEDRFTTYAGDRSIERHGVSAPSTITDFTPGEDQIEIMYNDGPLTIEQAMAALDVAYDAATDQTTISWSDRHLLYLAGDMTQASIALTNDEAARAYADPSIWINQYGQAISEEEATSADILIAGYHASDLLGEAYG